MATHKEAFVADGWRIDPQSLSLSRGERSIRIGERAMAVLCCLVSHEGDLVTKQELLDEVWQQRAVTDDVLTVAIYELRKAFGDRARSPRFIETIHGRGYRWMVPIDVESQQPAASPTFAPAATQAESASDNSAIPAPERKPQQSTFGVGRRSLTIGVGSLALLVIAWMVGSFWLDHRIAEASASADLRGLQVDTIERIAVLPLGDFGATAVADDVKLAAGLTGSLINRLAQHGFLVSAHASVASLGDPQPPLHEIADVLGVDALIEGSVRRDTRRTVIEIQLVDPASGNVIWADRASEPNEAALVLSRRLAASVDRHLRGNNAYPAVDSGRDGSLSIDLLDRHLEGRASLHSGDLESAVLALEEVRQRAPRFAENLASLVETRVTIAENNPNDEGVWETVRAIAAAALEVDPRMAEAHAAMGVVTLLSDWDFDAAERWLDEALRLHPSLPMALDFKASLWTLRRDQDQAIAWADRAVRTDPLNAWRYLSRSWHLLFANQPAEALSSLDELPAMVGDVASLPGSETPRAIALAMLDRTEESWALRRSWLASLDVPETELATLDDAVAREGMAAFYRAALEHLDPLLTTVDRAYARIHLGDYDQALVLLQEAADARHPEALWIGLMPHSEVLRDDPRFQRLLASLPPLAD